MVVNKHKDNFCYYYNEGTKSKNSLTFFAKNHFDFGRLPEIFAVFSASRNTFWVDHVKIGQKLYLTFF